MAHNRIEDMTENTIYLQILDGSFGVCEKKNKLIHFVVKNARQNQLR